MAVLVRKLRKLGAGRPVDSRARSFHTGVEMQLSFNRVAPAVPCAVRTGKLAMIRLSDLRDGEAATIEEIDLPHDLAHRLMELGFLPGARVEAARSAPGGDPRVYRVDGTEIALRFETASRFSVRM